MSSMYCARPVTFSRPSLRRTLRPTAPAARIARHYIGLEARGAGLGAGGRGVVILPSIGVGPRGQPLPQACAAVRMFRGEILLLSRIPLEVEQLLDALA